MKVLQSIAIALCFTLTVTAQSGKYNTAVFDLEEYVNSGYKDTDALLEALDNINATAQDAEWSLKPKTWFVKGKTNYYIFFDSTLTQQHTQSPFHASEGFRKSLSFPNEKFSDAKVAKEMLLNLSSAIFNRALSHFQMNDFDNAYKLFAEVKEIKTFLDSIGYTATLDAKKKENLEQAERDATYNAAIALLRLDKKAEAKTVMQELMNRNYDSPAIYSVVANFDLETGDTTQALQTLDKALARYPDNISLLVSKLNVFIARKQSDKMIADIEKAAKIDSTNTDLWFVLADAYAKAGRDAESEKTYLKVASLDTKGPRDNAYKAYHNLGAMYMEKANALTKRLMDDTKLSEKEYAAITEQRNGIYSQALPHLEKAYEIKPNDKQILNALKEVYAKLGQYDKSKQMKAELEKLGG